MFINDYVTLIKSTNPELLCKRYSLENGKLVKEAVANVTEGLAATMAIPSISKFAAILKNVTELENVCVVASHFMNTEDGEEFNILAEKDLALALGKKLGSPELAGVHDIEGARYAARLKRSMDDQCGWLLLDADNPPGMPAEWAAMTIADRLEFWEPLVPGISKCARIELRASSARVISGGEEPGIATHAWIRVNHPELIPVLRSHIGVEMVNQDRSFRFEKKSAIDRDRTVGIEARSVFDLAVLLKGRITFCSKPQLSQELINKGYQVTDANVQIINEEGGTLDISWVTLPGKDALNLYRRKTGIQLSLSGEGAGLTTKVKGLLTLDTEITRRGDTRRLSEWLEHMGPGDIMRCESPFRESHSEAALLKMNTDGSPLVHDVGNGTTYLLAPAVESGGDGEVTATDIERLQEFSADHAVVMIGSKVRVVSEDEHSPTFIAVKDCREYYSNLPPIWVESPSGRPRPIPFFDYWFKHPETTRYRAVTFHPTENLPEVYNRWKGWPITPRQGDCSKYLAHIHDNIANGDEFIFRWIIAWMADAIQNPTKRTGTALALRGIQGVGKGVFLNIFLKLYGNYGAQIGDAQRLTSRFNSQLANRLMIFADESFWAGDKKHEGLLKAMITESTIDIEYKGLEPIVVPNFIRLLMATNNDWVAPAGIGERRFAIIDVPEHRKGDRKYFADIHRQMNATGLAALMHYLLNEVDLAAEKAEGIDPAVIPKTKALAENKLVSANSALIWLHSLAVDGYPVFVENNHSETQLEAGGKYSIRVIRDQIYLPWCIDNRLRPESPVNFGRIVVGCGFQKRQTRGIGFYVLPTIAELKAKMIEIFGDGVDLYSGEFDEEFDTTPNF